MMISYAQNAEDVVLARVLPSLTGFYVDVGAADPDIASVTRHFYDLGWHGINIEPRKDAIQRLEDRRPRDRNLQVAAGAAKGSATLYLPADDLDLSTVDVSHWRALGEQREWSSYTVEVRTLDSILAEHAPERVDFIKIDVEGSEAAVLDGLDLERWQPTVLVIEAIRPWQRERTDRQWRTRIEAAGFKEGLFDGVNLYFAHADDTRTIELLYPVSVLDNFETAATAQMRLELKRAQDYVVYLTGELNAYRAEQERTAEYVRELEDAIPTSDGPAKGLDITTPTSDGPAKGLDITTPTSDGPAKGLDITTPTSDGPAKGLDIAQRASYRPPRPARLAIIGTPCTGSTFVRRVLADAFAARELAVDHPADIDWDHLPESVVIQLHWPRTDLLQQVCRSHQVSVLSVARHPLDVLISILHFAQRTPGTVRWLYGAGGDERDLKGATAADRQFIEWALGERARRLLAVTREWWQIPSTVRARYEHLVLNPPDGFGALLGAAEIEPPSNLSAAIESHCASRIHGIPGDLGMCTARPGVWRQEMPEEVARLLRMEYDELVGYLGYADGDQSVES